MQTKIVTLFVFLLPNYFLFADKIITKKITKNSFDKALQNIRNNRA